MPSSTARPAAAASSVLGTRPMPAIDEVAGQALAVGAMHAGDHAPRGVELEAVDLHAGAQIDAGFAVHLLVEGRHARRRHARQHALGGLQHGDFQARP